MGGGDRVIAPEAAPPTFRVGPGKRIQPINDAGRRTLPLLGEAVAEAGARARSAGSWSSSSVEAPAGRWVLIAAPAGTSHAQVTALLVRVSVEPSRLAARAAGLTERQREVLLHLLRGATTVGISEALGISWHTVRTHMKHVYRTLGISTRAEAMLLMEDTIGIQADLGWASPDPPLQPSARVRPRRR